MAELSDTATFISVPSALIESSAMSPTLVIFPSPKLVALLALTLIILPDIVRSVPSPSIFSPSLPKVSPTFAGMLISVVAVKFKSLLDVIVKSVPSPSIFSPSSPNVTPILEGIFISPPDPTVIERSVPSDSIFSPVAKVKPTPDGIFTSAAAVRFMLFPDMVRSVPSPSIFSASSPKVKPTLAGILTVSYTHQTLPTTPYE